MSRNDYAEVECAPLVDFAVCLDAANVKNYMVYVYAENGRLYLFSQMHCVTAICDQTRKGKGRFQCGINGEKFVSAFKKLYDGEVRFKFTGKSLIITKDNIRLSFNIAEFIDFPILESGSVLPNKEWFIDAVGKCDFKAADDKMRGLLLDVNNSIMRVCKFKASMIKILSESAPNSPSTRIVISDEAIKVIKKFKGSVKQVLVGERSIALSLESGVYVYLPLIVDSLPEDYISTLQLEPNLEVVRRSRYYNYQFDKSDLIRAIELVSDVLGDEGAFIKLACIGLDESSYPIWELSGTTLSGVAASEKILCTKIGAHVEGVFSVNRKDFLNNLKKSDAAIHMLHKDNMPLILLSDSGLDVTMLVKAAG